MNSCKGSSQRDEGPRTDGLLHRIARPWQCSALLRLLVASVDYLGQSDTTCVCVLLGCSVCNIEHSDTVSCLKRTLKVQVQTVLFELLKEY